MSIIIHVSSETVLCYKASSTGRLGEVAPEWHFHLKYGIKFSEGSIDESISAKWL